MQVTNNELATVPTTLLDVLEFKKHCFEYTKTLSEYEQDLAEQYGVNSDKALFVFKLVSNLMTPHKNGGKKTKAIAILNKAFKVVHEKLNLNPAHVLLAGLISNAPFVDTRTVKKGSINVSKKVFLSQKKRAFLILSKLTENNKRTHKYHNSLANEIIAAYKQQSKSALVSYKQQLIKAAKLAAE